MCSNESSMQVCDKLKKLTPYDPDALEGGIHLDANESFLELSDSIKAEIARKVTDISYSRYPDPMAAGACAAFAKRYGIDPRTVTAGNGSDELLMILFSCFAQKGDRVLLVSPDFSMYAIYAELSEVETVVLPKNAELTFDTDELIQTANRENVRFLIFSNPCNPTAQGISADEVLRIVKSVHCLVVVDEAYMDFWDQSVLRRAPELENLMVLRTCSKIGLAAARLGFAVAGPKATDYLRAAKSPYNVNTMSQAAGEAFLSDEAYLSQAIESIKNSRESLYKSLKMLENIYIGELAVFETKTNFVTVKVRSAAARHASLKARGVSVRLIGGEYFRITTGTPEENALFLGELEKLLGEED